MSDAVLIRGLEFEANHGCSAAERAQMRRFRVDLEIDHSLARAAESDRLEDTVDYCRVCELVVSVGTGETFHLLEALAARIGKAIVELCPGATVIIEVHKLSPPCPGVPESAAVRLCWPPPIRP